MRDPRIICETCGRERNPLLHTRAEFPPDAARAWIKRTCKTDGKPCKLTYRAGIILRPKKDEPC